MRAVLFLFFASLTSLIGSAQQLSRLVKQVDSNLGSSQTCRVVDFTYNSTHKDAKVEWVDNKHLQFDTMWDIRYSNPWKDSILITKQYDANNNVLLMRNYRYNSWGNSDDYVGDSNIYHNGRLQYAHHVRREFGIYEIFYTSKYNYYPNGVLFTEINTGTFNNPDSKDEYVYDAAGNLRTRVRYLGRGVWRPWWKWEYTSLGGKVVSETYMRKNGLKWDTSEHTVNTMTASLKTVTKREYQYWGATVRFVVLDSFSYYSSGNPKWHFQRYYNVLQQRWYNVQRDSIGYDAAHNETYRRIDMPDTNGNYRYFQYAASSYNGFNQPLERRCYDWDTINNHWKQSVGRAYYSKFTYELYTTNVPGIAASKAELQLYPSPASDIITIKASGIKGKTTLAITDMQGRLLRQWTDELEGVAERTIPVSSLASGNYILSVKSDSGVVAKQFAVSR